MGKDILKEMEMVRGYMANQEVLQDHGQSLEIEIKDRTEECATLQIQLQSVQLEMGQLGEEVQTLETLLEGGTARKVALQAERKRQTLQAT